MLAEVFVVGQVSRHIHLLHQLMNGVVSISQKTLVGDLIYVNRYFYSFVRFMHAEPVS